MTTPLQPRRGRRHRRRGGIALVGAIALVALVIGGVTGWALTVVLRPVSDPTAQSASAYVAAEKGTVASAISLNVNASWSSTQLAPNRARGTVTDVTVQPGDMVDQGDELYRADLIPVVVAKGEVPAFRDIASGTTGEDVQQLQQLLTDLEHFSGPIDGQARASTTTAIRAWQEATSMPTTGVVALGTIVFVTDLPVRIDLDDDVIRRGSELSGGEPAISRFASSPKFTIPATAAQAALMPAETVVEVTTPDGRVWSARTEQARPTQERDLVDVPLASADGETICAQDCDAIPFQGTTALLASVVTVAPVDGVVVPTVALGTSAAGDTVVVDRAGTAHPVEVLGTAQGMSAVDGIDPGLDVRLPAPPP